jgi:hypothetical protein
MTKSIKSTQVSKKTNTAKEETAMSKKLTKKAEVQATQTTQANNTGRANRITIVVEDGNYIGRYYRTHKLLATVNSTDTTWKPNADAKITANKDEFFKWLVANAHKYNLHYDATQATQAWDRQHKVYMTDADVQDDISNLMAITMVQLANKCKFDIKITSIIVESVTPAHCDLSYVEFGRYIKSGAWCNAHVDISIGIEYNGQAMAIPYTMQIKSGQICKPKLTITEFNGLVAEEFELNNITPENTDK